MKTTIAKLVALTMIAIGASLLSSATIFAQFPQQRPSTGSSVQYIPGHGVIRHQTYYDPTNNSTTTTLHGYYGSTFNRTYGNPVIRTIYVERWVWTPYGMRLIRQPVNVPVYR